MRFPLHVIRAFPESQHMDEREPPDRTLRARFTRSASPPSQRTHSATGAARVQSAYSWGGGPRASEATGEGDGWQPLIDAHGESVLASPDCAQQYRYR